MSNLMQLTRKSAFQCLKWLSKYTQLAALTQVVSLSVSFPCPFGSVIWCCIKSPLPLLRFLTRICHGYICFFILVDFYFRKSRCQRAEFLLVLWIDSLIFLLNPQVFSQVLNWKVSHFLFNASVDLRFLQTMCSLHRYSAWDENSQCSLVLVQLRFLYQNTSWPKTFPDVTSFFTLRVM